MRILIAAGGTGGHIFPGITIAQTIRRRNPEAEILFVGSRRGMEADIVPRFGFAFDAIPAHYLRRQLSLDVLRTGFTALRGLARAAAIVRRFRPDVAVGTGGYVSGPVVAAALLLRVPVVIQEQNAFPGLTNRVLGRFACRVALGNAAAQAYFRASHRVTVTGNPIRSHILTATRGHGLTAFGLEPSRPTLLVFGGSQGGRTINRAVQEAAPELTERLGLQMLHQTGRAGFDAIVNHLGDRIRWIGPDHAAAGRWHVLPFIHDMPAAYAAADLVISRAGAITLAEVTARGLPSVLVPYPFSAEGHQEANARVMAEAGAAVVVPDRELDGERLVKTVEELLRDPARLERMARASRGLARPDAAERIASLIEEAARRGGQA
ncbi:MAG: undecaprenyldiphospho-muramoylpentapeptide beta-N-acetylglucosaminyltransferase [Firmicutes bacterium]|nr:undecaprenyldiphospho-muramoylpentapeptide beta-N-acetylglucosaminyltransferase [Bacillota bacterium]